MDLEQALQLIDRALASVQGNRETHVAIVNAWEVVSTAARQNEPKARTNGRKPAAEVAEKIHGTK